jgi:SSS family transporter
MTWLDWLVLAAFLVWVVADGLQRASDSKTLEGYYAGQRSIPWWAAGLSVMATQASAITVIGTTGQGHDGGMEFVQLYFGLAFAMILLCIFIVPLYRALPILTAYEYLEHRFGPATRTLASAIFLISRGLALAIVLYAPAVVLSAMTGLDLTATILIIGLLTTLYTMIGGVSAVIWTDVKQMSVIIGGLLLCLGIALYDVLSQMSFSGALRVLGASGKLNALELQPASLDFVPRPAGASGAGSFWDDKYNFWSGLIGGLFLHLSYFGCDQSQVQRILTNPSVAESRKALLLSAFAKVPMQAVVLFIGVLMYAFFVFGSSPLLFRPGDRLAAAGNAQVEAIQERYTAVRQEQCALAARLIAAPDGPRSDAELLASYQQRVRDGARLRSEARKAVNGGQDVADTNYVFPYFLLNHVPIVLLGLIVAAIFAAAMSSADSAFNSLSAATVVDFYRRWLRPKASEQEALRAGHWATAFWGVSATLAALLFEGAGSVIELINKVGSWFYGSLLGVFVLAIVCKRAGPRAGVLGLLGGMAAVLVVHWTLRVEFLWYNVVGCVGVLIVGISASFFERPLRAARS